MPDGLKLLRHEFRPGFDWVARELALPQEHQEAVFEAVYGSLYGGLEQRLKVLLAALPDGAGWPNGYDYLQESLRQEWEEDDEWQEGDELPEVSERHLFKLLLIRFSCVANRLYRNRQIREFYSNERFRKEHPFIEMNRHPCDEHALCGRGSAVQLSIEDGLRLMEQLTCSHPACRCTFDPSKG